ncbi:MAG: bacteriohemerythrin [Rhodospirillales bacterium]
MFNKTISGRLLLFGLALMFSLNWDSKPLYAQTDEGSAKEIIAVFPENFPPYYLIDDAGQPTGFAIETLNEVARLANINITYRSLDSWSKVHQALREGKADIAPNMGITEKRKKYVNFTIPYEAFRVVYFIRKASPHFKSHEKLAGLSVGAVKTHVTQYILEKRKDIHLHLYDEITDLLNALINNEIDVVAYPEPVLWHYAKKAGVAEKIKVTGPPLKIVNRGIAVRKDNKDLLAVLDQAIKATINTETFDRIYRNWMSPPPEASDWKVVEWALGIVAGLIIVALAFWYLGLRRRSRKSSVDYQSVLFGIRSEDQKRILALIGVMTIVSLAVMGTVGTILYNSSFNEAKERLLETARSHARLMEAIGIFDAKHYAPNYIGGPYEASISQIKAGLTPLSGSIEVTLAKREGDNIVYLVRQKSSLRNEPAPIAFSSPLAEPMRRALSGKSGTVVGLDYRNVEVLAAHEPVDVLDLGIVVKMDMAEIRAPFIRAGLFAGSIAVFIILVGTIGFQFISNPMIRKIQLSEARFKSLYHDSPVLMHSIDANGNIIDVNEYWLQHLGYERDEVIGHKSTEFLTGESRGYAEKYVLPKFFKTGECHQVPYQYRKKDGSVIDVLLSATSERKADGSFTESRAVIVDITERKKSEEALEESEQRYMRLADNTPAGIWQITPEGETVFINHALARMFELDDPEEAVGHFYKDFVTPDSAELIRKQLPKRHEGHTSQYEIEIVGKKGGKLPVLLTGSPIFSLDGKMVGRIATLIDISDRKLADAQVIQAAKLATLGEMATSVAHELNQPLSIVRMAAGNVLRRLKKGDTDPTYINDKLDRITSQTERAANIINHMRIFGRKSDENPYEVDLCNAVEGTLSMMSEQIRLANIELVTDLSGTFPKVLGHQVQIEQVILNLLTNARDAIKGRPTDGGGKITIAVGYGGDDWVRITVFDNGGGIPEKVINQVFDPFFTTKELGKGTGLGLSVSYGIIHDMGGTIEVENADGGAKFTITLPVAEKGPKTDLGTKSKWSVDMSVGVEVLDADHRRLFDLVENFRSVKSTDKDAGKIISKTLGDLHEYTDYHLKREETLMEVCGYPDLKDHRKKHRKFVNKVLDFADELPSEPGASHVKNIADFLEDWLVNHILKEDKDYKTWMTGKDEVIRKAYLDFERTRQKSASS